MSSKRSRERELDEMHSGKGGSQEPPHPERSRSVKNFLLTNVVGVKPQTKKRRPIPEGYTLAYTRLGQAYLRKIADEESPEEDAAATDEHRRKGGSVFMCSSQEKLASVYGEGIYQYFDFVKFLFVSNTVIFGIGLISLVAHLIIDGWNPNVVFWENFFLTTYSERIFHFWFWSIIACAAIFTFGFGPWLSSRIKKRFELIGYDDDEDRYIAVASGDSGDVIKDETGRPKYPRRLSAIRMIFSYLGFIFMLAVSNVILIVLVVVQSFIDGGRQNLATENSAWAQSIGISIGISVAISIMAIIWKKACVLLTQFEQHYTFSRFLSHHTVKFFVWRILNVCIMFLGRWLVAIGVFENTTAFNFLRERWAAVGNPFADRCRMISILAEQYTILLIIDLTVGNLIEIVLPLLWLKFQQKCCGKVTNKDLDSGRMDFDVAEEYLELLYRQFIVYMGVVVFPCIGFIGMLAQLVEYPLDKWRLIRISKTPPPLRGSMHTFLVFFLFLSAIISIIVFPYGVGWSLAGYGFTESRAGNCTSVFRGGFFSLPPQVFVTFNTTTPTAAPIS